MEKEEIVQFISAYRKSSAFIAAFERGIFRLVKEQPSSLLEMSQKLNMNEHRLLLILFFLEEQGMLLQSDGKWKLDKGLFESYTILENMTDMIHHERNIFASLMYPGKVEQALCALDGQRDFDLKGFGKEEQKLYDKTMYGKNLRILAFYLMRVIRLKKNPAIVEYGRSRDTILNELSRTGYQFEGFCMPDESSINNENLEWTGNYDIFLQSYEVIKFDIVLLYNSIHYYSKETLKHKLTQLRKVLRKDALVIVIDIFYQEGDSFSAGVLMDWLTHGGVYFPKQKSVEAEFESSDFTVNKTVVLKEINSKMIIFQMK